MLHHGIWHTVLPLFYMYVTDSVLHRIYSLFSLWDLLESEDNVMADRGFDIADVLEEKGIMLNIPPFLIVVNN